MKGERFLAAMATGVIPAELRHRVAYFAARRGMPTLVERPDTFCASDHSKTQMSFRGSSAIVLGDVFYRPTFAPSGAPLSEKDLAECARTSGRFLIDRCWGSYVGLFFGPPGDTASILRAPFGRLPIYFVMVGETIVAASCVELLLEAADLKPSIDWSAISHHLRAGQLREPRTSLVGVHEVLPGCRLTVGDAQPEIIWKPHDFCTPAGDLAFEAVASNLRTIADACVGAWSRTYNRVVLGVSGGLDSSVVATAAVAAGADVACLTLATVDPAGDERIYARDLAEFLDCRLHEFLLEPHEIDLEISAAAHLPRPVARSFAQSSDRRYLEIARETDAKAFFSGGGGDNVFCYLQSVSVMIDALVARGVSRRTWQAACDLSALTGASLSEIFRRALGRVVRKRRRINWNIDQSFLTERSFELEPIDHPWLPSFSDLPPGKQAHIVLLMNVQNHLDGFGREKVLPIISPLLSQPLIEFCLSIPTWLWLEGGQNRAPVRHAYARDLPPSVLNRRTKGTPDSFLIEVFETHRLLIKDMLVGGLLAQEGLLDVEAIDKATSVTAPARDQTLHRLLALVDVEAWVRSWRARA